MAPVDTIVPFASATQTSASITMRIGGGLGNQMFQYASGLGLSHRIGAPLTLDISQFSAKGQRPFALDQWSITTTLADPEVITRYHTASARWRHSLSKRLPSYAANVVRGQNFRELGHHFHADAFAMRPPAHFRGYFQSERYFSDVIADVRRQFTPRNPLSAPTALTLEKIRTLNWPVSLHVRRGDYITDVEAHSTLGLPTMEYYRNAIRDIQSRRSGMPHFFLFSDDPDWVREAFAFLPNKTVITGNDDRPWEDIVLMAACHDHIIANSTFSWWGAWLNPRADKTVIAPKRWFAGGDPKKMSDVDVVPPSWIRL
jgi:hypothetical protein